MDKSAKSALIARRELLRRGVALGIFAAPAVLTGCATSGGRVETGNGPSGSAQPASEQNPFGVDSHAPLEVLLFNGGYGLDFAEHNVGLYTEMYPDSDVTLNGSSDLSAELQPRFVQGNPPDVTNMSGLDVGSLAAQGQLADLNRLFDAPSIDDAATTVRDTLLPGTVQQSLFSGAAAQLNYAYNVFGIWYSRTFLDQKGWEYPQTWPDMLALCEEIKNAGLAPFTYAGTAPSYVLNPLLTMAAKAGGQSVLENIDNLEADAWRDPAVEAAAAAWYELRQKGYILEGSEALTHTQSQTYWTQNEAVFIPNGSWLENEMSDITPDGFEVVMSPTPRLSDSDAMPFEAVEATSGTPFAVPSEAENVAGGLEFLRVMLSKPAARKFSELTNAFTSVAGAAEGLDLSTAFTSVRDVVDGAGENIVYFQVEKWYTRLSDQLRAATGALMAGDIGPVAWIDRCQSAADAVAQDESISKHHR